MSVTPSSDNRLHHPHLHTIRPKQAFSKTTSSSHNGSLCPNLQPPTPPVLPVNLEPKFTVPSTFGGKYVLRGQMEASSLYRCINTETLQEYVCTVVPTKNYHEYLLGHLRMDGHPGINMVEQVSVGPSQTYILFLPSHGDLHSYVRSRKRLRESEAVCLFHQIASIVADCHKEGIILRDLKLRKFVFTNPEKTRLKLETLEDAVIVDDPNDDALSDKHGCPTYMSPEILVTSNGHYSGKAADCWSLGVILYTMLMGRYPFHDIDTSVLFSKIKRGNFVIPDTISIHARCLIRSLLRREPSERLTAEELLSHKWFELMTQKSHSHKPYLTLNSAQNRYDSLIVFEECKISDQIVPDLSSSDDNKASFSNEAVVS